MKKCECVCRFLSSYCRLWQSGFADSIQSSAVLTQSSIISIVMTLTAYLISRLLFLLHAFISFPFECFSLYVCVCYMFVLWQSRFHGWPIKCWVRVWVIKHTNCPHRVIQRHDTFLCYIPHVAFFVPEEKINNLCRGRCGAVRVLTKLHLWHIWCLCTGEAKPNHEIKVRSEIECNTWLITRIHYSLMW